MRGLRKRLGLLAKRLLEHAVTGEPSSWSVRCGRRLLRMHPGLYLVYCYRTGRFRELLRTNRGKTPRSQFLQRLVRKAEEACAVLDGKPLPVTQVVTHARCSFNDRVLLAFHSSANFDPAGYTVRSLALMKALAGVNVQVTACTRLGYPWDLIKHQSENRCEFSMVEGQRIYHFEDPARLFGGADSEYLDAYAQRLCDLAQTKRVSVIHAASNYLNGLAAAAAARRLRIGSVYEMRGLWHITRASREPAFRSTEWFAYIDAMEVEAARACDRVVVISQALKHWLLERGIEAEKIHVVANAAELDALSSEQELMGPAACEIAFTVGFIGSLTHYEGLDDLIRAVAALLPTLPDLRCIIVGDGTERRSLQRLAVELGCQRAVDFVGRVPRDRVASYYQAIDVFPLPRRRFEVCELVPPLKPLEVMAFKKALIVSDVAALAEMVEHERTGLIVPSEAPDALAAAILRLQRDPDLRQRLAEAGRDWVVNKRNWNLNACQYLDMYQQIGPE